MKLYNIWVSLSEMSDKKIDLFHDILIFLDVPVMLHSRAIEIIINTSSLVRNWPYKSSLKPRMSNFWLGSWYLR